MRAEFPEPTSGAAERQWRIAQTQLITRFGSNSETNSHSTEATQISTAESAYLLNECLDGESDGAPKMLTAPC